jgi:hydroxymethylpyrimidine pyrophosphatase-like HAD family hydrolase
MIKKDKIFELKIEEDDELSGIDSISLVDEPAIEVNWMFFNKEKPHEFHIPDGEDDKYIEKLISIAQDEQELFDEGWVVDKVTIVGENEFVSTSPNAPSIEDEKNYNVRYKYILNPRIKGQGAVIPTTRDFCRSLISKNYVWRIEDMEKTQNDFGDSAMVWRGGYNCRHVWARIEYKKDATIVNKASVNKGKVTVAGFPTDMVPDTRVLGIEQPSTVTEKTLANPKPSTKKNLGLSKVYSFVAEKVSIDYDDTLSTDRGKELAKKLLQEGKDVSIITRRQADQLDAVYNTAKELGIPRDKVHATNGKLKWETIKKLGIERHIDNNSNELKAIAENLPNVTGQKFEVGVPHYTEDGKLYEGPTHKDANGRLMTGAVHTEDSVYLYHEDELPETLIVCKKCGHSWDMMDGGDKPYMCNVCGYDNSNDFGYDNNLPSYVDQLPKKKKKQQDIIEKSLTPPTMFESHSDYPDSVKNNAKAVLKWVDENGWGSCGTDVGKQRANQLAKGEPISDETVRRMYSYLSRHAVDLDSSKGYGDGCGKLMYDSWGGKTALSWAEAKVKAMDKEKMSKQRFQTDDEKRIVLGPAMIPDVKIFRKDNLGNPYYVYFSSDTIKMIAEKYMRNKYIDNNDEMHNGKAVSDVYVIESWIKESENDKSTNFGYGDLPVGTWFVSMKVRNDETWNKIKEGKLNGFSVSGYFEEVAAFCREEMFLQQVAQILKNIED